LPQYKREKPLPEDSPFFKADSLLAEAFHFMKSGKA
jgi:hypothetical protein